MEDQLIINEFLIESNENLARLDQEMVELEKRPKDAALLASVFRTIHTIKGTCGFLGFEILEGVSHIAESILSQVRAHERELTPTLVSLVLETVDAIKQVLNTIEAAGSEGSDRYEDLCRRLRETEAARPEPADIVETKIADATTAEAGDSGLHGEPQREKAIARAAHIPSVPDDDTNSRLFNEQSKGPSAAQTPSIERADPKTISAAAPPSPRLPAALEQSVAEAEKPALNTDNSGKSSVADSTIRVDVVLLDRLMNLVGELVLARNQILQFNARQEDQVFNATSQRLNLITSELQESVMKTRMQPIGNVWNKLPRVVRDLSAMCGKQISLEMDGADTELDKTIIEVIKAPLTHIVRNCCDHGIERPEARVARGKPPQGRLFLRAFHEGGHVNIEITDDGAGIDGERVKQKALQRGLIQPEQAAKMSEREATHLIFMPGLSTAEQVSNISGRGVGMDVVRTNIEKIGGVVDLTSERGSGTTVKIKIPLTLAIIPGLGITGGAMRGGIPRVKLLELIRGEGEQGQRQIERIHGAPVYRRRGQLLPLVYLNELLKVSNAHAQADVVNIVVLQAEERQFGLVVDGISDTQEIVVKPLGKLLKGVSCYAGATIMGDGKVALILDVMGIAQRSGVMAEIRDSARPTKVDHADRRGTLTTLLLFQVGAAERLAVPLSLVARLEEFPAARIERAAGDLVIQYRARILPLLTLDSGYSLPEEGPVQVVVFNDGERQAGLIVDRIVDIVDEHLTIKKKSGHPGILGSAVVGQKVTDFLDLEEVLFQNRSLWGSDAGLAKKEVVLVADASSFSRGLLRSFLEMEGHVVIEAAHVIGAFDRLLAQPVSLVLVAPELPGGGGQELLRRIRTNPTFSALPVAALAASSDQAATLRRTDSSYSAYPVRTDRESVLESIRSLASAIEMTESGRAGSEERVGVHAFPR